ncbi:phosphoribosyltransferase family protein [Nocardia cyriacigeorgica]|uniref:phosphoribosyltransferase family protein n=1 Tax=Nocardia cyriacigeorgica TaxID=135487 RepID=UPI003D7BEDB3
MVRGHCRRHLLGRPRVLLLDDFLATGGTLSAAADLFVQAGVEIVAAAVVLELEALGGGNVRGSIRLTAIATV